MTELEDTFAELGISQYLDVFLEQGFDTWETILDITESDFDALGVKLGHRRRLQRKIADYRGVSADRALGSPARGTPTDDRSQDEARGSGTRGGGRSGGTGRPGAKRKYRRHPKPDENAPERPPSAYVIFSNKMRDDLKGRTLSFTEIAKLVGENWQSLSPEEKEIYEREAFNLREKYNSEMAEYKKTENFRIYSVYLAGFKAKQAHQQQTTDPEVAKRPKLEVLPSTSNGTISSTPSQSGDNTSVSRMRVDAAASGTSHWQEPKSQMSPALSSNPPSGNLGTEAGISTQSSPSVSSTSFPSYRETAMAGQQSFPRREPSRDDKSMGMQRYPSGSGIQDTRSVDIGTPVDAPTTITSDRRPYLTDQQCPPPLTHESTTGSSRSNSSYFTPRTPKEAPFDRALPIPSIYSQKPSGSFDSTLPPLRPPSLSPQTSMFTQQSPSGVSPLSTIISPTVPPSTPQPANKTTNLPPYQGIQAVDFQHPIPPMRSYPPSSGPTPTPGALPPKYTPPQHSSAVPPPQQAVLDPRDCRMRDYMSATSPEDADLDPVSALIKAGEIVNRSSNSRRHRPPGAPTQRDES